MNSTIKSFSNVITKVEINDQILWIEKNNNTYKVFILFDDAPICLYEDNDLNNSIKFLLKHCGKMFGIEVSFASDDDHYEIIRNLLGNYYSDEEVEEFVDDEDFMRTALTIFKAKRREHLKEKHNHKLFEDGG